VNYQFDGRTAAYTVKDAEQFVPAVFENFVWFTDAELTARIRSSVPLFTGVIPLNGNLTDQVCTAIDSLLKAKGVPPRRTLDVTSHNAVFHLAIQEGPLYRMGKLDLLNLAPDRADLVRRVWELHEDDVYNASYAKDFLIMHRKGAPLDEWLGAVFTQTVHEDTLAVDLSLKFEKLAQAL